MTPPQYIHVRNWDRYQHPDTKRGERRAMPWIKSYTQQTNELEWLELSFADFGLLEAIRLQYAQNRAHGLRYQRGSLSRLFGKSPRAGQIERLNHAGYIVISACKLHATCLHDACVDLDLDKDLDNNLATASRESDSSDDQQAQQQASFVPEQATNGREVFVSDQPLVLDDADADIPLLAAPENGRHLELVATPDISARPRDDIWDLLEIKFGPVGEKGSHAHAKRNAHKKRNTACADLRAAGATVDLIRAACDRWPSVFKEAAMTDIALATHYPLLVQPLLARADRPAPCAECELGGGAHAVGCSRAVA